MSNYIVTEKAQRPARMDGSCFYCRQNIGDNHNDDCVLIHKKAIVEMKVRYEVSIPDFWTEGDVLFHRNESSWCSTNMLSEIDNLAGDCICDIVSCTGVEILPNTTFIDEK
jgi:hypothetical protein